MGCALRICFCAISCVSAGICNAESDALFEFHHGFVAKAGHEVGFANPQIVCSVRVPPPAGESAASRIVFLAEAGMAAEVWALADFPIRRMGALWTGGAFGSDPANPQTAEWAWIYDRNGDGLIDWLSYLYGSLPVLPEGGFPSGFPGILEGKVPITNEQFCFFRGNGRVVYNHILYADFDGTPDHVLVAPISQ